MSRTLHLAKRNKLVTIRAKCIKCNRLITVDSSGHDVVVEKSISNKEEIKECYEMLGGTICKHCRIELNQFSSTLRQAVL